MSKIALGARNCETSNGSRVPNSENNMVIRVKEKTMPQALTIAPDLICVTVPPNTRGRIGITHGDRIDNIPAI
jgi:hypothetical protein